MNNKSFEKVIKSIENNSFSHAYLIDTNNIKKSKNEIIEIIKNLLIKDVTEKEKEKIKLQIDSNTFTELIIIEPIDNQIKVEQVNELLNTFKSKSTISKYKIYLILSPEKMNKSSANSILKFVEEPEENIIGFFITENIYQIISTIRSRCNIIRAYYDIVDYDDLLDLDKDVYETMLSNIKLIIKNIEQKNLVELFFIRKKIAKNIDSREKMIKMLRIIKNIYFDKLNNKNNKKEKMNEIYNLINEKDKKDIVKKIKIIEEITKNNMYNVNIELSLDRFFIEMGKLYG